MGLADVYDHRYRDDDYRVRLSGYEVARADALGHFIRHVAKVHHARRVLDYGSGSGLYVPLWEQSFPEAELSFADISPVALEQLAERHPRHRDHRFRVEHGRVQCEDGRFDVVVSVEVMEHVEDLDAYLRDIHRVLRPGGHFVWTTPCANPLSVEHVYSLWRREVDPTEEGYRRWRWEDPTHLRRLRTDEAAEALARCGFRPPSFRMRSHFFSFVCTRARGLGVFGLRERLMKLDYRLLRRLPNGASMIGVAQKA